MDNPVITILTVVGAVGLFFGVGAFKSWRAARKYKLAHPQMPSEARHIPPMPPEPPMPPAPPTPPEWDDSFDGTGDGRFVFTDYSEFERPPVPPVEPVEPISDSIDPDTIISIRKAIDAKHRVQTQLIMAEDEDELL